MAEKSALAFSRLGRLWPAVSDDSSDAIQTRAPNDEEFEFRGSPEPLQVSGYPDPGIQFCELDVEPGFGDYLSQASLVERVRVCWIAWVRHREHFASQHKGPGLAHHPAHFRQSRCGPGHMIERI